jgi:hypothetical protein
MKCVRRSEVLGVLLPIVVAGLAGGAAAQPPPLPSLIKPAPIAKATKHPGPLIVEAEPTSELSKGFGTPLWAIGISSADGSFGHAAVLLVSRGSFLTPQMMEGLAHAADHPQETVDGIRSDLEGQVARATVDTTRAHLQEQLSEFNSITAHGGGITRRLTLPNGRVGYVTALGFGAGGATFVAALPSPDDRFELLVVTGNSLENEGRKPNAKSQVYEKAMRERPLDVTQEVADVIYAQEFPPAAAEAAKPKAGRTPPQR